MLSKSRTACCAAIALLLIAGCGGGAEGERITPNEVQGTVTYNGKPMKGGGAILFLPIAKGGDDVIYKEASGTIAEDGTYTLMTYEEGDGAAAGEYRVVIHQTTVKEPENTGDGEKAPAAPIETVAAEERIPQIYADATKSPEMQTVKEGYNKIDIDIKPQ